MLRFFSLQSRLSIPRITSQQPLAPAAVRSYGIWYNKPAIEPHSPEYLEKLLLARSENKYLSLSSLCKGDRVLGFTFNEDTDLGAMPTIKKGACYEQLREFCDASGKSTRELTEFEISEDLDLLKKVGEITYGDILNADEYLIHHSKVRYCRNFPVEIPSFSSTE